MRFISKMVPLKIMKKLFSLTIKVIPSRLTQSAVLSNAYFCFLFAPILDYSVSQ